MNWGHLRTTLWLRWRILVNRVKRGGKLGKALAGALAILGLLVAGGAFAAALVVGREQLPEAGPMDVTAAWMVIAGFFLMFWMIGLLTDLQRSDAMSLQNFLHLPVSLKWAFLYNYLSSFAALSIGFFLPMMLGLWIAMVVVYGPSALWGIVLIAGFLVMVTAVTYQFRGWLGRLMQDKRKRSLVVASMTFAVVLIAQLPNLLINFGGSGSREERRVARRELRELERTAEREGPEQAEARAELARRQAQSELEDAAIERKVRTGLEVVPLGWLPRGMLGLVEARPVPPVLCTLGMLLIGAASLRRSYRSTVTAFLSGPTGTAASAGDESSSSAVDDEKERGPLLVERRVPFVSETVSAVTTANLRSLLRAHEIKLLLLSPIVLLAFFAMFLARGSSRELLQSLGPGASLMAIAIGLFSVTQVIQNQFGLDRKGFRALVLSPIPRHEILIGKNLAVAPLALGAGLLGLITLQIFQPFRPLLFVGACLQLVSGFLIVCMTGNLISILGPMRLQEHGLKAANTKSKAFFWQFASMILIPIALSPLALPALAEWVAARLGWARSIPWFALLHALGLVAAFLLYRWMVRRQGEMLQQREQTILDTLTR